MENHRELGLYELVDGYRKVQICSFGNSHGYTDIHIIYIHIYILQTDRNTNTQQLGKG